jgi:hypothetical protein
MIALPSAIYVLKTLVVGSIFFVWVVRYQNIIEEFKSYGLPAWLRDFVGILKLSFSLMLITSDSIVILLGASGITVLMIAAMLTHLRVKNPFYKMLPSMSLMIICLAILLHAYSKIMNKLPHGQLF